MNETHAMSRSGVVSRRIRYIVALAPLGGIAAIIALMAFGCGDDTVVYEPLPVSDAPGRVLAGTVHAAGDPVSNAIVTLETSAGGLTAMVRSRMAESGADAGISGAGLSGADVGTPTPAALEQEWGPLTSGMWATVSDTRGRFAFAGVTPGAYVLRSDARDHLGASLAVTIPTAARPALAETTFVNIDLTPTGTFFGQVTLENATIHASTVVFVEGTSYVALTDPAGSYALTGVPIGTWIVRATHPGYIDQTTGGSLSAAGDSVGLAPLELLINSNIPPTATALPPTNTIRGAIAHFSGSGEDIDGVLVLYEWDFEDDGIFDSADSNSASADHIFPVAGDYRAKLRVTDDDGAIGLAVVSFTVTPNQLPTATAYPPENTYVNEPALFDGTGADPDGSISLYEWDFENDGTFDYADPGSAATWHTYASEGAWEAVLRVWDNNGASAADTVAFTIAGPGVFVSVSTGSPGGSGAYDDPVTTIAAGLAIAQSLGRTRVVVAIGTYPEVVALVAGIGIYGGRDPADWRPLSGQYSVVSSGTSPSTATAITSPTRMEQMQFSSASAPSGQNAIALSIVSSASVLAFDHCRFVSGRGGGGAGGASGGTGSAGASGGPGGYGDCDGPDYGLGGYGGSGACSGGGGGRGGYEGSNPGVAGSQGSCSGGSGGYGGAGGDPGQPGGDGQPGGSGTQGSGGSSASPAGSVIGGVWSPYTSSNGYNGYSGSGGGGGGGGGGQGGLFVIDGSGNGGGGGGAGGSGGLRGYGAQGGWGSFSVYLYNASPTFTNCYFQSGQGGSGGSGGSGGYGGSGGAGGYGGINCTDEIGAGGDGGAGGTGGRGGGGAGGPGGPSYCVYRAGSSSPTIQSPTYSVGGAGTPGAGGSPNGSNGSAGYSGTVGP
jgi:hypothetical protein